MKAALVLLLFIYCLISPYSFSKESDANKRNTSNKTAQSNQQPENSGNATTIGECNGCFDVHAPDSKANQETPYDPRYDSLYRKYLLFTVIGVCSGVMGIGILIWQTIVTRTAANAAKNSADALINSERAWLQAKIQAYTPLSKFFPPPNHDWVWLRIFIKNYGKTPAKITRLYGRAHLLKRFPMGSGYANPPILPVEPAYDPPVQFDGHIADHARNILLLPHKNYPFLVEITSEEMARIRNKEDVLYVYGYVDYLDVSGQQRQMRFCRFYWIPFDSTDSRDEGFMESNIIPEAYTESS